VRGGFASGPTARIIPAMAGSRRGGGPPDLKGTLGTLLRTTLHQVGVVKDAVLEQAQSQRRVLDGALLDRRRREALAALGEAVYRRALAGDLGDLEDDRDIASRLDQVAELDRRLEEAGDRDPGEAVSSAQWAAAPERQRFHRADPEREMRVWRPSLDDLDDDGGGDDRPTPPSGARAARAAAGSADEPGGRRRRRGRPEGERGGGIAFVTDPVDPDDDLEAYMHPDDVPGGEDK
jgi:hypothetical protein